MSALLDHAVEEGEGVEEAPEHGAGLAPGVELIVLDQVRPVEADQVGLDALRPLYDDLDTRLWIMVQLNRR